MAKKDRFPEGYSSGFAPNYESEGSGSSGRIDTEINASENSSAPRRIWIMLNPASRDGFGVPIKVLPVSKMSLPERKDLVLHLRAELEQIQVLQKKVESQRTNFVTLSSSSDILSCNNAQNVPTVGNMRRSSALTSGPGKKLNPASDKGCGWNRGTSGRFESAKQPLAPCSSNSVLMKQCESLLKKLMLHDYGWVFNSPVDVVKLNLPDYFDVIKHPMDLGTIKKKIASCEYSSPLDFLADVRLTFANAMTYNPPGNDAHLMANTLSKFFEVRWKVIEKKLYANVSKPLPEVSSLHVETNKDKPMPPSKKRKISAAQHKVIPEPVKRIMAAEEKHKLSRDLESLLGELPDNIIEFLKEQSWIDAGEDEIEIDIDTLSDDTLFKLKKLLDDYQNEKSVLMKQCESLLKKLMLHDYGWVFNSPVDVVKLNFPDYFDVIKHPMDLGTVKKKIASCEYSSPLDFLADVRLTFANAMTYNPPGNDAHLMANTLSKFFEVRWKVIEKKLYANVSKPLPEVSSLHVETNKDKPMPPSKKRKISAAQHKVLPKPVKLIMAAEEKHKLSRDLESLLGELPDNIIEFLKEQSWIDAGEDEIEIDIDTLSDDTLFKLKKLLDDYQNEKQNNAKGEPCEIELLNESGLSNSSMQLHTGNELMAEDVDIGGSEPPVSSYPPIEKQKDSGRRSNKCISPGSSSDSDSSSSSDGESDFAKATSPVWLSKDDSDRGADLDEKARVADLVDGNQSASGLDQLERTSQQKPNSVESDCCQDGESALVERSVSPDKLYRAALLKNRFADTILKAREKTLNQGEKGDPEKLRLEREELELQKRKEKARLQAEAKAAEDARRRSEAEAAAESKRQRDLEREAARQALLKMEKTVEINENSRFLEDLEMLRTAPPEQLLSSVDETSPDRSQDGLGSFKFVGSNPLEQLGLYMKVDEDEEEVEPPPTIPNLVNDVEEGEID